MNDAPLAKKEYASELDQNLVGKRYYCDKGYLFILENGFIKLLNNIGRWSYHFVDEITKTGDKYYFDGSELHLVNDVNFADFHYNDYVRVRLDITSSGHYYLINDNSNGYGAFMLSDENDSNYSFINAEMGSINHLVLEHGTYYLYYIPRQTTEETSDKIIIKNINEFSDMFEGLIFFDVANNCIVSVNVLGTMEINKIGDSITREYLFRLDCSCPFIRDMPEYEYEIKYINKEFVLAIGNYDDFLLCRKDNRVIEGVYTTAEGNNAYALDVERDNTGTVTYAFAGENGSETVTCYAVKGGVVAMSSSKLYYFKEAAEQAITADDSTITCCYVNDEEKPSYGTANYYLSNSHRYYDSNNNEIGYWAVINADTIVCFDETDVFTYDIGECTKITRSESEKGIDGVWIYQTGDKNDILTIKDGEAKRFLIEGKNLVIREYLVDYSEFEENMIIIHNNIDSTRFMCVGDKMLINATNRAYFFRLEDVAINMLITPNMGIYDLVAKLYAYDNNFASSCIKVNIKDYRMIIMPNYTSPIYIYDEDCNLLGIETIMENGAIFGPDNGMYSLSKYTGNVYIALSKPANTTAIFMTINHLLELEKMNVQTEFALDIDVLKRNDFAVVDYFGEEAIVYYDENTNELFIYLLNTPTGVTRAVLDSTILTSQSLIEYISEE